ncbi:MAG: hypothetical protein WC917_04860, partial [Bacilli bacterium]
MNEGFTGMAIFGQGNQSGFDEGTYENILYNGSALILDSSILGTYTSKVFDAGAEAIWNNLSWIANNFGELSDNQADNLMLGNVLLLHMNNNWEDSSGENNDGVSNGAIFSTDFKLGSASGDFDGNSYVDFGSRESLISGFNNGFTIGAWIKVDSFGSDEWDNSIVSRWDV